MEILVLIIAAFITSSISAILGMGGGIILLGIMAIIIPDGYMVIALHGIIQLISNTTRTYVFKPHIKQKIVREFFVGALIGAGMSAFIILVVIKFYEVSLASEIKVDFLKPIIGIFIVWYLFLKKSKKEKESKSFVEVGNISGFASIFIGATGPLIAPFFLNHNLMKEEIIANKAACQMITHLTKIPLFIFFFNVDYFSEYKLLLPLIMAVFIGTIFGKKILGRIPEKIFNILFRSALFIIAIRLILGY